MNRSASCAQLDNFLVRLVVPVALPALLVPLLAARDLHRATGAPWESFKMPRSRRNVKLPQRDGSFVAHTVSVNHVEDSILAASQMGDLVGRVVGQRSP
jgi:hypothetical protein